MPDQAHEVNTAGKSEQDMKPGVMSHREAPKRTLAGVLQSSYIYRQRFMSLLQTLRKVERGEL